MNENYNKNKLNHTIGLGLLIFILLIIITLILRFIFEDSKWYFETFTQPLVVLGTGWFIQKGIANEQNKINNNNQQEKCLKDYLQEIKELTINEKLGTKDAKKEVIEVAKIITESTIRNLDGKRNASLTYFLYKLTLTKKTYHDEPNFLTLLYDLNLEHCELEGGMFYQADLTATWFKQANLKSSNFIEANLIGANFEGANLQGANLQGANLQGANFEGANLRDVDLRKTKHIKAEKIKRAKHWESAKYDPKFRKDLGLPLE